jgi:glycine/D-amino acid oxidase-like deaminating enzyme/nitrite reductase/ring-hydroxylating ferredoxin subunit
MQTLHPLHALNNNTGDSVSLWMEEEIASTPPLNRDLTTDVCIVGGGIVGLSCAYQLIQRGLEVAILEAGSLGGGQTSRTTGHLAWALDDRFYELENLFGLEGARLAAESHREAIKTVEKIAQEERIDCDLEKLDAYLFLAPEDSPDILEKEWNTLQKIGMPVKKIDRAPIRSFDSGPCLQFPDHAQFHIFKYLKGLIQAILRKNGKIFTHTHVNRIQDGSPCYVMTDHHHIVTAKSVIVATNTPINDRLMIHTKQAPYRTYVIAGTIPKDSVAKGLYYDTPDPYHYIRLQKNESDPESEWLIVGGEDHKTGQETDIFEIYDRLEDWTRHRFPMLQNIAYRWSGQIIEPVDSLAFIGRNPHDKNIYIATGDSGNGLTHGTLASLLLAALILEGSHPWEQLYNPARKTLQAAGEYAKENLNVAAQYGEWIMPGELDSIKQIAPGTGATLREGLKKIAVYKDEQGNIHCYSAVCPHLGCIVKWNPGEKSWDCPCHGSRFNIEGQVLNGPAISPLTPIEKSLKN